MSDIQIVDSEMEAADGRCRAEMDVEINDMVFRAACAVATGMAMKLRWTDDAGKGPMLFNEHDFKDISTMSHVIAQHLVKKHIDWCNDTATPVPDPRPAKPKRKAQVK